MTTARNHTGHSVGENHHRARLTDKEVREMRFLRGYSPCWSYRKLAERYGCSLSTVRDIVQHRTRYSA